MSSSADAPGDVLPGPDGGQEGQAARPGGSAAGAAGSRARRRLVRNVTALAVVAAVVAGLTVAFAGHPAPAPSTANTAANTAAGAGAARPAALADEAAATVAVVKTSGSITGGPVLGRDGQLWLVELSQATGQPVLAAVSPASYAVSTHPLPASLGGISLRYTGAEAFDNLGQLWLGAKTAPPGRQPTGILVRYTPATGAVAQFSLGGNCSDAAAAQPAQLFTASDGGVWVECAASQDPGATFIARLDKDGAFTVPSLAPTLSPALQWTRLWAQILARAKVGPLVPDAGGAMWGMTTGGVVQVTAAGTEMYTPAGPDATGVQTEDQVTVGPLQLVGNGAADSVPGAVEGLGECRGAGPRAGQARECVVSVDPFGYVTMLAAAPDYDGQAGNATAHPAGMDASGDVWFIVDGKAGGVAPQGQYFFEVNSGGGTRVIPFSVPGDARPVPVGQAPVITMNGAVWTADPEAGPGALVEVMPRN
jgi:hypothetical protein